MRRRRALVVTGRPSDSYLVDAFVEVLAEAGCIPILVKDVSEGWAQLDSEAFSLIVGPADHPELRTSSGQSHRFPSIEYATTRVRHGAIEVSRSGERRWLLAASRDVPALRLRREIRSLLADELAMSWPERIIESIIPLLGELPQSARPRVVQRLMADEGFDILKIDRLKEFDLILIEQPDSGAPRLRIVTTRSRTQRSAADIDGVVSAVRDLLRSPELGGQELSAIDLVQVTFDLKRSSRKLELGYSTLLSLDATGGLLRVREWSLRELASRVAESPAAMLELAVSAERLRRQPMPQPRHESSEDEFWRGITRYLAHEVGNPVSAITVDIETIRELCGGLRPFAPETVDDIVRACDRARTRARQANKVVAQMRDLQSTTSLKTPADVADVLSDAAEMARAAPVAVEFSTDLEPALVECNPEIMSQVFVELVENSLRHFDKAARRIAILGRREGMRYRFVYTDNGAGIPRQLKERIFEPSYGTNKQGSGLGLTIIKHSVERLHGGSIAEVGEPGVGARFVVEIPVKSNRIVGKA